MTDNEINIAIAEACGWIKFCEPAIDGEEGVVRWLWHKGNQNLKSPPSYTTDLNAMHEAEKLMTSIQCVHYRDELESNTMVFDDMIGGCVDWQLVHATARQRAEAFLRTIGKWKDA